MRPLDAARPRGLAASMRRFSHAALLVLAAFLASACAGAQHPSGAPIVWPAPPEKPRIKYVRSFQGVEDFNTGIWNRLRRALTGADHGSDLKSPNSLTLSRDGQKLYAVCGAGSRITVFDFAAGEASTLRMPQEYQPRSPFALAIDAAGNLFITDQAEHAVWVFSPRGDFVRRFGKEKLTRPAGIAIDDRRQLVYVVDAGDRSGSGHAVQVFAPDGRYLRQIGTRGTGPGEFLYPTYAVIGPDEHLYVSDTVNSRLQVFDPEGVLVTTIGSLGEGAGQFGKTKGLAFDSFGNLHVVDAQLSRVQILNSRRQALMAYGGLAPRIEFMQLPSGIAIDAKNNIYVADYAASRVNQYVLFNTTEADALMEPTKPGASPANTDSAVKTEPTPSVPAAAQP